jgi:gas vesicle protein
MDDFKKEVDAYKEKIKPVIERYILEWQEDINDYYDDIQVAIIEKCRSKIYNQKNETEVKQLITKSVNRTFSINEEKLNRITKKLNDKIDNFIIEQKAKLQLEHYFLKNNSNKIKKEAKESFLATTPEYTEDNKMTFIAVGGSIIAGTLLATIAAPLSLIALTGIAYERIILKPGLFRKNLDDLMDDIESQIIEITQKHKMDLENVTQENVETILDSISNDITEAYLEKEKLYKDALSNRNKNIDNNITQALNKKLEEIDKI